MFEEQLTAAYEWYETNKESVMPIMYALMLIMAGSFVKKVINRSRTEVGRAIYEQLKKVDINNHQTHNGVDSNNVFLIMNTVRIRVCNYSCLPICLEVILGDNCSNAGYTTFIDRWFIGREFKRIMKEYHRQHVSEPGKKSKQEITNRLLGR